MKGRKKITVRFKQSFGRRLAGKKRSAIVAVYLFAPSNSQW